MAGYRRAVVRLRPCLIALALIAVTLPPLSVTPPSWATGVPRCDGRAATVVGTPGRLVVGTNRPDVIVSNGAVKVKALRGDDLVCVTGPGGRPSSGVTILAGRGDDLVRVDGRMRPRAVVEADLGPGRDRYVGGPGRDVVTMGGEAWRATEDNVTLGAGDDTVTLEARRMVGAGRIVGGEGQDEIDFDDLASDDVTVDNGVGTGVTSEGEVLLRFSGLEIFSGYLVSFVGTARDETVGPVVQADMGAGDDVVDVHSPDVVVNGGEGRDRLQAFAVSGPVDIDLTAGTVSFFFGTVTTPGFEDVLARAYAPVTVVATDEVNDIQVEACGSIRVDALGGDDVVGAWGYYDEDDCFDPRVTLDGGHGDDDLRSGFGRDTLIGGRGTDVVDGGPNEDVCGAETEIDCELDPAG